MYVIAHDVGTGGNKAVLVRTDGALVGSAVERYPTYSSRPGWVEQEPDDWWSSVTRNTQQLLQKHAIKPEWISCLVFCTQMLGIIPVASDGRPLRRAIIWMDARAESQAKQLMRRAINSWLFTLVAGGAASGKDVVPKLIWLQQHEPSIFKMTAKFLDVNGYLVHRCTGEMIIDWTAASVTGLFDLKRKRWNRLLLRLTGTPVTKLPALHKSIKVVGGLGEEAAQQMGLQVGTAVVCGGGDAPMAALGTGAVTEGSAHLYLGTSGWVGVTTVRRHNGRRGVATIQSADPDRFLLLAETETAGACLEWLAKTLYVSDGEPVSESVYQEMNQAAATIEPGAGNLVFMPWLTGERAPVNDISVRSAFINLRLDHTLEHMTRAVYEGIAYNYRWILEILHQEYQFHFDSLRVIGEGTESRILMQILADVTNRRIEKVTDARTAGAKGAALAACLAMGYLPDFAQLEQATNVAEVFNPQEQYRSAYNHLFDTYKQLYTALKPIYRRLN